MYPLRKFAVASVSRQRFLSARAFSLVEIVLAIGIVAFSALSIIGLLPVGLNSLLASTDQTATANITQDIKGQIQQISFASTSANNVDGLAGKVYYYTKTGIRTTDPGSYFYKAVFSLPPNSGMAAAINADQARTVTVRLLHPYNAPASGQQGTTFSLFIAKQTEQ